MKIEKATIEFETGIVQYPEMKATDLAHELIRFSQPKLEIKLTDERREQFIMEASKSYIESKSAWDAEEFTKLYVKMATEKYFAIERCNHAYNEMILAYEEKIKDLKTT